MKANNERKLKYIVIVYKPTLIDFLPDIIGYYTFDSDAGVYVMIKELNLKLKYKCSKIDDTGEQVEAIIYYCEE
jgi:hypothetical protein